MLRSPAYLWSLCWVAVACTVSGCNIWDFSLGEWEPPPQLEPEPREADTSADVGFASDWTCASAEACRPRVLHAGEQLLTARVETCAVLEDGQVVCWGADWGDEAAASQAKPHGHPRAVALPEPALDVAVAGSHRCAVLQSGRLACWGLDSEGVVPDPQVVQGIDDAVAIAASLTYTCVRSVDGTADCWKHAIGEIQGPLSREPAQRLPLQEVSQLVLGHDHGCALHTDGRVSCWGENHSGQLGQGTYSEWSAPVEVRNLRDVRSLAAGPHATCAVDGSGDVYCWGFFGNAHVDGSRSRTWCEWAGERPPLPCLNLPTRIDALSATRQMALGREHACALGEDGRVRCWGSNRAGQLGDGTLDDRFEPTVVLDEVTSLVAGRLNTCAQREDGSLRCWGDDEEGALGIGNAATWSCVSIHNTHYPCEPTPTPVLGFGH